LVAVLAFTVAMWILASSGFRHLFGPGKWGKVDTIALILVVIVAIASTAWLLIL